MSGTEFAVTDKQIEILNLVINELAAGRFLQFKDLRARLSYGSRVSKQAIQCSIRFLESHGMIERVYGAGHGPYARGLPVFLKPTPECISRFRSA